MKETVDVPEQLIEEALSSQLKPDTVVDAVLVDTILEHLNLTQFAIAVNSKLGRFNLTSYAVHVSEQNAAGKDAVNELEVAQFGPNDGKVVF